ncbi:MAG: GNAT family N-acetyltransferase [Alphaproteobacteria bacterium]|nr:GNAT family N-acetyltransferase [Alphaproteobacteria bacterium]
MSGALLEAPTIDTARLRLRAHALDDFAACFALWSDPAVTTFIGGRPSSRDEVWSRLLRYVGHWRLLGYGFWLIEDRETGAFVGEIGFADFKRGFMPDFDDHPEMGWALSPAHQGKGYASEAARAAMDWAQARFPASPFVCMIDPANAPSIRVAEKIGFTPFAQIELRGSPVTLYRTAP